MRFSEVGFCDSMMYYAYTQNERRRCLCERTTVSNGLHVNRDWCGYNRASRLEIGFLVRGKGSLVRRRWSG